MQKHAHEFDFGPSDHQRGEAPGFPNARREIRVNTHDAPAGESRAGAVVQVALAGQALGKDDVVAVELDIQ
jgi:hypothetical protein